MSRDEAAELLEKIRKLFIKSVESLYQSWIAAPRLEESKLAQSKRPKGMPDSWAALCEISAFLLYRVDSQLSQIDATEKVRKWAYLCAGEATFGMVGIEDTDTILASRVKHYAGIESIIARRAEVNPNAAGALMCASLIQLALRGSQSLADRLDNEKQSMAMPIDRNEVLPGAVLGKATDIATGSIVDLFKQLIAYFPS